MDKREILRQTHDGLFIYSHILQQYYPGKLLLCLVGDHCQTTRNPFLGGSKTLNITRKEGLFCYSDSNNGQFAGDPFGFANHFYHLPEDQLLRKLIGELHLNFHSRKGAPEPCDTKPEICLAKVVEKRKTPLVSYFNHPIQNTRPSRQIELVDIYRLIRGSAFQPITQRLRSITDRGEARLFKSRYFDYVTFSGTFSKRADSHLLKHSCLIAVDFDHITNIEVLKMFLLNDPCFDTVMLFVSPSGDGLKWIIPIDIRVCSHQEWFQAIAAYIRAIYDLGIDPSGKDVSRACFLPHDPDVWIHPYFLDGQ